MKKILVTGSSSFLGHHVMPLFKDYNTELEVIIPTSKELNLLEKDLVIDYISLYKPEIILHMAALCGGIGANKTSPAEFSHDNLKMFSNIFDGIRHVNKWDKGYEKSEQPYVTHFYGLGTVCSYPKYCPVPFKEEDIWNGYPEETNAPYGNTKRMMLVLQNAFRQQFGLKGAHLICANMFGEYDHFDLKKSHVIPALINKMVQAKKNKEAYVEVWGDGTPTREFLYAGDCAKAIVKAVISGFDYNQPINIGTGEDICIKDLANLIKNIIGFTGDIRFTGAISENGQPKRRLDVSKAKDMLDFVAETSLINGLNKTIQWYLDKYFKYS